MTTPRTALEECLRLAVEYDASRNPDEAFFRHRKLSDAGIDLICRHGKALSEALGGWLPIESANFDGEDFWLFWEGGDPEQFVGYWSHEYDVWLYREELVQEVIGAAFPTHWRPLPPPPTSVNVSEKV